MFCYVDYAIILLMISHSRWKSEQIYQGGKEKNVSWIEVLQADISKQYINEKGLQQS